MHAVDITFEIYPIISIAGNDADGEGGLVVIAFAEIEHDPFDNLFRLGYGGLRQEYGKFVAAQAKTEIDTVPGVFIQGRAQGSENFIAFAVPIGVIVGFEIVDIQKGEK
jgi:hypothetical protein